MTLDERGEVLAAYFLLPFGEHDDIDRQRPVRRQVRLQGLHMQIELALVVHGAARINAPIAHRGLERRRVPQLEWFHRLDVVVAVDQVGRRRRPGAAPLTDHDRMAFGLDDFGAQSGLQESASQPLRRPPHVTAMF